MVVHTGICHHRHAASGDLYRRIQRMPTIIAYFHPYDTIAEALFAEGEKPTFAKAH